MVTQGDALGKLKNCVDALGDEWAAKSDGMFVNEYGLQSRLAGLLWSDKDLWFRDVLLKYGQAGAADFPAVYREWYAAFGAKGGNVDIAILVRSSVTEWVAAIRHYKSGYARAARELPVLAGVQIKSCIGAASFNSSVREDLDNLLVAAKIEYRCQLIFYNGTMPRERKIVEGIVRDYLPRIRGQNIYIYLCPSDDPLAKPKWLPVSNWVPINLPNSL